MILDELQDAIRYADGLLLDCEGVSLAYYLGDDPKSVIIREVLNAAPHDTAP